MHNTTDTIQPGPIDQHQLAAHRYQCHHTFPDGARCGSPALRNETRCYYHHETRKPVSNPRDRNARMNTFELPFPDSRTAVQSAAISWFASAPTTSTLAAPASSSTASN